MWQIGTFKPEECCQGRGFIFLHGVWGDNEVPCVITNIYNPCSLEEKKLQWEELVALRSKSNVSLWCVVGDFNSVRSTE